MASTGEAWRLGRRPALDAVRGVAILLVLICHAVPGFLAAGTVGVTLFFALSGFLITSNLLEQQERDGRLNLRRFYRARALRLVPGLVALVAVSTLLFVGAGLRWPDALSIGAPILLYIGNWTSIAYGGGGYGMLGHTWSLAVEEQFYLLWPFVLILLCRGRKRVPPGAFGSFIAGACLYAVVARIVAWDGGAGLARVYLGTDMHADAILIGCGLALAVRRLGPRRPPRWLLAVALCTLGACSLTGDGFGRYVVATTVVPLAAVPLLLEAVGDESARWLSWSPLRLAGKVSYGLYLWNYPAMWLSMLFLAPTLGGFGAGLAGVLATVAAATVSWVLIEQPFLRLKDRAPTLQAPPSAVTVPAG